MKFFLCVLALWVVAARSQSCNTDPCVLSCVGCDDDVKVPDPDDCHSYYKCHGEQPDPLPLDCPTDMHYDPAEQECVDGDSCVGCETRQCYYHCLDVVPNDLSLRSYQFDCTYYIDCDTLTPQACPADEPFFDGYSCQSDESLCCSCKPYCTIDDVTAGYVFDPVDCSKYWNCDSVGPPTEGGSCDSGENFDQETLSCSSSNPCATHQGCYNVVGSDHCIDLFTCETIGLFPKCLTSCVPEYYYCTVEDIDNRIDPYSCLEGTVYDPDNHMCISPEDCPYASTRLGNVTRH